jgi:drug/metabolite transporter (DMT)-like permease
MATRQRRARAAFLDRAFAVEGMLAATILLWALNLSVTRYILTHGFQPLAYTSLRYGIAAGAFAVLALLVERTLRVSRRHILLVLAAGTTLFVNQLGFVYAVKTTSASLVALIIAAVPVFAAVIGLVLRTERLTAYFWAGAGLTVLGVGLVALGTGGEVHADVTGVLLGVLTAATWAVYSMLITPLMRHYSPIRISALVLPLACLPVALVGADQNIHQDWSLGWHVWALFAFAVAGPLVLTNFLWFRSLGRIGAARATLASNLQPFVAALLAVVLLSETLSLVQCVGGALIAVGVLAARNRPTQPDEARCA